MKKLLLLCIWLVSNSVFSATGWFQDYIKIDVNGAGTSAPTGWYWIGVNPSYATQFAGFNFGVVNTFVISGCDMKYWSDNQDRTGGAFYYKIMSSDGTTQIVAPVETIWTQLYLGGNDYQGTTSVAINLISGLSPNTTYQLHVWAKSWGASQGDNWLTNGGLNYVATFTTQQNTFSGTGEWTNPARWNFGVPSNTSSAVIKGVATINSNVIIDNVTINNGFSLTVNPGKWLTVDGVLANNGSLTIKSDVTGTGSLKHTTTGVFATVERYITGGWSAWNSGWHLISSPVANQDISAYTTTGGGNDYDFYGWDEPTDTWRNFKDAGFSAWNGGTDFKEGKGYLISYEQTQPLKSFTGFLHSSDVTKSNLSATGISTYSGFHLLGNPFACALKWNDGNWALNNVAGISKIWSETGKSYIDVSANGYIPSAQGFMVQVNGAVNSITIPVASRVHNSAGWYKSDINPERICLVVSENEGGSAQESVININPLASEEFDFDYDSRFLAGYAPMLYSVVGDEMLSTNSLPSLSSGTSVPFGFVKNEADNFDIELREGFNGRVVFLTDLKTNQEHNLSDNPVYSFVSEPGDDPNRFLLHFSAVGIDNPALESLINIYSFSGNVIISGVPVNAEILVYNLLGQVVLRTLSSGNSVTSINAASLPEGIYVVSVLAGNQSVSKKVVIR